MNEPPTPGTGGGSRWGRRLQAALMGAILGSIVVVVWRLWKPLQEYHWQLNAGYLVIASVLLVATVLAWAAAWAWMLGRMRGPAGSLRQRMDVFIFGNVAKYLPGSLWNYVARGVLGTQSGMPARAVWGANLVELVVALASGLSVYGLSLLGPHQQRAYLPAWLCGLLVIGLLALVSPPALRRTVTAAIALRDRLRQRASARPVPATGEAAGVHLTWPDFLVYYLLSVCAWSLSSLSFFLMLQALQPLGISHLTEVIGLWSFAAFLGMVAIGVPQGLGVKEGFLVLSLAVLMPLPAAVAAAGLSRLWVVACDLLATALWWGIGQILSKYSEWIIDPGRSKL